MDRFIAEDLATRNVSSFLCRFFFHPDPMQSIQAFKSMLNCNDPRPCIRTTINFSVIIFMPLQFQHNLKPMYFWNRNEITSSLYIILQSISDFASGERGISGHLLTPGGSGISLPIVCFILMVSCFLPQMICSLRAQMLLLAFQAGALSLLFLLVHLLLWAQILQCVPQITPMQCRLPPWGICTFLFTKCLCPGVVGWRHCS